MAEMSAWRQRMVDRQIEGRDVRDPLVLAAMRKVPRHVFVPEHLQDAAYDDCPLPIGSGQTISQPYIVAYMIEAMQLRGGERVLEIGAGSGYAAAVLGEIAAEVYTIECIAALVDLAIRNVAAAGCKNVHVRLADGTEGWSEHAPFDAILVSAGAPEMPAILLHQLAVGGRMVVPVGSDPHIQTLMRATRLGPEDFKTETLCDVRFVPLIGKEGWHAGR